MDSEIISREIILKLITNTIYANENKRINQEIAPHCSSFSINDMINPIIAQSFIPFDYDDSEQSQRVLYQDTLFFDNKRIEENTWFEIKEPECPREDRCCPSKIQMGVYEEKPKEDITELQNSVDHSRMNTFILRLNENNEEEQQPEENKKIDVIDLPSYDLALNNFDDQNSSELQKLREEFEEKKAKLLEKKKEELMIEWRKKEEIEMKKPKKKKDFNFKKIRFDCSGNIIDFKPLKMNDLKSFHSLRQIYRKLTMIVNFIGGK